MTDASQPWDGVPLHPERDGWHWLHHPEDLRPFPSLWNAEVQGWPSGALHSPQGVVDMGFTYLGPCLTPTEAAALAEAAAVEMRERAKETAASFGDGPFATRRVALAIEALPLPAPSLDAIRAEERRKGLEEMARVVSSAADEYGGCEEGEFYIVSKINAAVAERIEKENADAGD